MAISVLTGFIFGLIPSWATAAMDVGESLKETSRSTTPGSLRHRIRNALVVGELALALLLLVGAGLLMRAFWMLHSIDPGFNPDKILTTGWCQRVH
jgi:putative ABC transport system permease protein